MGLLTYAQVTGDARLKEFVREGYEYYRNWGIARIGLLSEMCSTGDMTFLALKLCDAGVGDYYEDVDQYVRNVLIDRMITDPEKLRQAVKNEPILARLLPREKPTDPVADYTKPAVGIGQNYEKDKLKDVVLNPKFETEDNVIDKCVGVYLSDAGYPTEIPKIRLMWNICCSGNATSALYYVWESIVRCDRNGHAQVNLLLNRASPWMDIDSYLPYEGKVVIRNKSAQSVSVRIPRWVDKKAMSAKINNQPASTWWIGNYSVFENVRPTDVITITFPMVESREKYTLKWKKSQFWIEGTDPGSNWKNENPEQFTLLLRGNTLVDIEPRPKDAAYPCFERDEHKKTVTPMKTVKRFVSNAHIKW